MIVRKLGAASEREKLYSSSGTVNSTAASLARGESSLSVMAMIGTARLAAVSAIVTTSLA